MVNQSKVNDQRFWQKWKRAGAVGSLDSVKPEYPSLNERFKQMYGVDPTSREAQEVVRRILVVAYDDYKEHESKVRMRETHNDPYYKRWFPNWPWDAIRMNEQKLGQIDTLVALAKPFFPHMCLDFFVDQAGNTDSPSSKYLLMRTYLTPQQRHLLTGNAEQP